MYRRCPNRDSVIRKRLLRMTPDNATNDPAWAHGALIEVGEVDAYEQEDWICTCINR